MHANHVEMKRFKALLHSALRYLLKRNSLKSIKILYFGNILMKANTLQMALMWFLLTTLTTEVNALALVDLELKSSLNQPLDVTIELLTSAEEELDGLEIEVTGISPGGGGNMAVPHLQHELIRSETGNYIRVTSRDAVREPALIILVEITWSEGHFLREYSLLVDPK